MSILYYPIIDGFVTTQSKVLSFLPRMSDDRTMSLWLNSYKKRRFFEINASTRKHQIINTDDALTRWEILDLS